MPHSYVKVWIHAVWATKLRRPYIKPEVEKRIHGRIKELFEEMNCPVNIINGTEDHVHVLFGLSREHSISQIMKNVKGKSCYWIRQEKLIPHLFEWQGGYAAFGVDYENLDRVFFYIRNQKTHHKRQDYNEELKELERENGD